jgi:hypothetical protein
MASDSSESKRPSLWLGLLSAGAALVGATIGGLTSYAVTSEQIDAEHVRDVRQERREIYTRHYTALLKWEDATNHARFMYDLVNSESTIDERDKSVRDAISALDEVEDSSSSIQFAGSERTARAAKEFVSRAKIAQEALIGLRGLDHGTWEPAGELREERWKKNENIVFQILQLAEPAIPEFINIARADLGVPR